LILTHTNPDADTISSGLALSNFMYENKIKHKVFNTSKELPRALDFLPRFDKITNQIPCYYDLVIYVDCADKKRVNIDINDDVKIINIDHHQSNTMFADINIVNDKKASNAEVLFEFLLDHNVKISKNMAICLYVGIYDDSNAFTTPRTDAKTFENINKLIKFGVDPSFVATNLLQRNSLARYRIMPKILNTLELHNEGTLATVYLKPIWLKQTGALVQECDDIVNMVLSIGIVKVVAYFRIVDQKVRVSLRSKDNIDVSKIANKFNGGGHKNAAGLTIDTNSIEKAMQILLSKI
jgi:phosphoesterase RecJ-like protein